jgi:hypothetical protein
MSLCPNLNGLNLYMRPAGAATRAIVLVMFFFKSTLVPPKTQTEAVELIRATGNSLQPTWPFSIEKTSVLQVERRQGTGQWAVGSGQKGKEAEKHGKTWEILLHHMEGVDSVHGGVLGIVKVDMWGAQRLVKEIVCISAERPLLLAPATCCDETGETGLGGGFFFFHHLIRSPRPQASCIMPGRSHKAVRCGLPVRVEQMRCLVGRRAWVEAVQGKLS